VTQEQDHQIALATALGIAVPKADAAESVAGAKS
jgi:hypothetical protein